MPLPAPDNALVSFSRPWWRQPDIQLYILLMLLASIPLYYELGRNPVQLWDESRQAVNAAEMARNGNWLITHFEGQPDLWNTKPPLLIWLQAISFLLFGYSEVALRLPTALATTITLALLYFFAARTLRQPLAGFAGGFVLVTSVGYIRLHVARTGDYDALLVLWQTLIWISLFRYLETGRKRDVWLLAAGFVGAVLTKGVAGLLGVPALFLYVLYRQRLGWLLRQRILYLLILGSTLLIGGYYGVREWLAPGYLHAVMINEVGGRFGATLSGHQHPWDYYLHDLLLTRFVPWKWFLLPVLLLVWRQPAALVRHAVVFLALFSISWLVVISSSQTKLEWYDAPIYPPLALLVGLSIAWLGHAIVDTYFTTSLGQRLALASLLLSLAYAPYQTIVQQIIDERHSDYGTGTTSYIGRYLRRLHKEIPPIDSLYVIYPGGYDARLDFYDIAYQQQYHQKLTMVWHNTQNSLRPRNVVVVCDPAEEQQLDSLYQTLPLHSNETCHTLLIIKRR